MKNSKTNKIYAAFLLIFFVFITIQFVNGWSIDNSRTNIQVSVISLLIVAAASLFTYYLYVRKNKKANIALGKVQQLTPNAYICRLEGDPFRTNHLFSTDNESVILWDIKGDNPVKSVELQRKNTSFNSYKVQVGLLRSIDGMSIATNDNSLQPIGVILLKQVGLRLSPLKGVELKSAIAKLQQS